MKKMLIISVAAIFQAASSSAQTASRVLENDIVKNSNEQESVTERIKPDDKTNIASFQTRVQFNCDFGNMDNVQWGRIGNFEKATFMKGGHLHTAYYDFESNLVGTTTQKEFTDLPVYQQQMINKNYGDYQIKEVLFFEDNEANDTDMFLYGQGFDDADNYFVVLQKDQQEIVLQANRNGVSFFKSL